ncbi:hypothetical protein DRP05_06110 [Archaeoglobales archaeon]|nr:MAG: hypothetical protein DRP05_06110 [Archaeoglobales archaeon]
MLEALMLGIVLGIISGLTPGIHNNTFAAMILAYLPLLSHYFTPQELGVIVFTNAIVHSFIDIIPSVLIGVPEEDTAIAVLPAHDMVLDGKGFEAISISAISSLMAFLLSTPIFLLFVSFLSKLYNQIYAFAPHFLILVSIFVVMSEKAEIFEGSFAAWRKRMYALLVFLTSGFLGFVAFEYQNLAEVNIASSIFIPLLTGLFAAPTLIVSFKTNKIPKQIINIKMPSFPSVLSGSLSGALVSLFPGVSSGIATVMASAGLKDREKFIAALSSANTSNAFLCFAILFAVGRVRSGAASVFLKLGIDKDLSLVLFSGIFVSLLSTLLVFILTLLFLKFIERIRFDYLSFAVLTFLFLVVYVLTGTFGLAVFIAAIPIGLSTIFLKIRRISCMGCLVLPLILNNYLI